MKRVFISFVLVLLLALPSAAQRSVTTVESRIETLTTERDGALTSVEREAKTREIYELKAQALAVEGRLPKWETTRKGRVLEIEFREAPRVEDGVLIVYARTLENGEPVALGAKRVEWERFRFVNPPVKVPDGTFRTERIDGQNVQLANHVEDTGAALREIVAQAVGQIVKTGPPTRFGSIGRTTTVVYADNGGNGVVYRGSVTESWSTIRDNANGSAADTPSAATAYGRINSTTSANSFSFFFRSHIPFDVSSVGSDQSVISATLSIYGTAKSDTHTWASPTELYICESFSASPTAIASTDYRLSTRFGTTVFGSITYAAWNTAGYNDITINAAGIASMDLDGWARFAGLLNQDFNNTPPSVFNTSRLAQIVGYYSDRTGTAEDPKLTIEHEASGTAPELAALVVDADATSVTLSQPTFDVEGDPLPAVEAFIGFTGTISETDGVISDYIEGEIDVSASGFTFEGLDPFTSYTVYVVADNEIGYDVASAEQLTLRAYNRQFLQLGNPF